MVSAVRQLSSLAGSAHSVLRPAEENGSLGEVERSHPVLEPLWNTNFAETLEFPRPPPSNSLVKALFVELPPFERDRAGDNAPAATVCPGPPTKPASPDDNPKRAKVRTPAIRVPERC